MKKTLYLLGLLLAVGSSQLAIAGEKEPISFADDVAPILVSKCLACHNARTAKGRFSVDSYQSLMRGGESGEVVSPGDGDFSTLVLLLESGDMPKESDPLSQETIAKFKQWIVAGAKLNRGVEPSASLTTIIPKPVHPTPPTTYAASAPVNALAYRPGTSELALSGYHEVLVFDSNDGKLARRISNIAERVLGIAFTQDGRLMAVASGTPGRYGEVSVFDASTGEMIADLASSADCFWDVAVSPDGLQVAAVGSDRSLRIWSIPGWKEILRIENHSDWVTSVAFSKDSQLVATGSRDKTAKVFDIATQETLATFTGHSEAVTDVLFSPDGKQVVSCGLDQEVRWWTVSDAKQKKHQRVDGPAFSLHQIDAQQFACGTAKPKLHIFDFQNEVRREIELPTEWINVVNAQTDGPQFAVGALGGLAVLFKREIDQPVRTIEARPPPALGN